jgi:hypothetical protein
LLLLFDSLFFIPLHEIFMDGFVVSKFGRKHAPLASAFEYIEDAAEDVV